jgi:thiamine biosynthesis lipoprotein
MPRDALHAAFVEQIMGLPISIHLRGPAARAPGTMALVREVFAGLRRIDALFSTYRADSEVSRINSGVLGLADADPLLHEVHDLAEVARARTDGLFDIHLPNEDGTVRLDPSGIVKGWAAQRAFDQLETLGDHDVCLNAGGDVVVGTAGGGAAWRVGIENPDSAELFGVLVCERGAVATSGTGARGAHLIDPRDGSRPQALRQVTVTGPSLIWADILATAACIQGSTASAWLTGYPGYQGLLIEESGVVTRTPGLHLQ